MSEIKVGDRVSVYGYVAYDAEDENNIAFLFGEMGIVLETHEFSFIIEANIAGENTRIYPHPKQCRKLVKMKKCDNCYGDGEDYHIEGNCICLICMGKGKVKV